MSGEIRYNAATAQWVVYAPERGARPQETEPDRESSRAPPVYDPACPFCPGQEDRLPQIKAETCSGDGTWLTRVVPNKFPALTPGAGDGERHERGPNLRMCAFGLHEVIIESPRHDQDLPDLSAAHMRAVIETYQKRVQLATADERTPMVVLFRNHGARAGTSLRHPHAQLVAAPVVPLHVRMREAEARRYHAQRGRCLLCDTLQFEEREDERVLLRTEEFLVFVPFAAETPAEVWLVPKVHESDFALASSGVLEDLARVLQDVLRRLRAAFADPAYNLVVTGASHRPCGTDAQLHWYVQVRPRLTTPAGFEVGSGMAINPSLPERDAQLLRAVE